MSINLMPWREERRKRLQKEFTSKLGLSAIAAVMVVVLSYTGLSIMAAGQDQRNNYLKEKIESAEAKIEEIKTLEDQKKALLSRKQVIENLQANRDQLAHIYHELATNVVDGVLITSMEHKNNVLEIKGKSTSNSSVAAFMNRIESSAWFNKPEIVIIQNEILGKTQDVDIGDPSIARYEYNFVIKTGVKNPNAPVVEEQQDDKPSKDDKKSKRNKKEK